MAESKLFSLLRNKNDEPVIFNSLGYYFFQELLNLSKGIAFIEVLKDFVACELSTYYHFARMNSSAYSRIDIWRERYKGVCDDIISQIGKNEFTNLVNKHHEPDSLNYKYRSTLWLIADPNKHPYTDPIAVDFGLNLLFCIEAWRIHIKTDSYANNAKLISKGANAYADTLGLGNGRLIRPFPESVKKLQSLFLSLPLNQDIKIVTQIVLSKFPIVDTMGYMRQFLYEEFEGVQKVNDPSLSVQELVEKAKEFLTTNSNAENLYSIDGPVGPQQVMRLLSGSLLSVNGDLTCQITCGVVNNIYDIYLKYRDAPGIEWLNEIDKDIWTKIRELLKCNDSLSEIVNGNLYRDTYEYMALINKNIYLSGKLEEQSDENASLVNKNLELEKINTEQKEQIQKEIESNELLICETIKYLEELDREKEKKSKFTACQ